MHDVVEILQRLWLLQFYHGPGAAADQLFRLCHILRPLYEGKSYVIGPVLEGEFQVRTILVGQSGYWQYDIRYVDALMVRQWPADDDHGFQRIAALVLHAQAELAVIEQERTTDLRGFNDFRM